MEIQETLIKDSEVIGISPLMRQEYPEQAIFMLYRRFQWSFDVYTKSNIISIKSGWIDFDGRADDTKKKAEDQRQDFKKEFDKARENISSLINKDYATTEKGTGSTS